MKDVENLDESGCPRALAHAIKCGKLDLAQLILEHLRELNPRSSQILIGEVWLLTARGCITEALHHLAETSGDQASALRASCLRVCGDPLWKGIAEELLQSPDDAVRSAMKSLLLIGDHDAFYARGNN